MSEDTPELPQLKSTTVIAGGIAAVLLLLIMLQHNLAFKGTIVLPAGGTYLGPTTTQTPAPTSTPPLTATPTPSAGNAAKAPAKEPNSSWVSVKGNKYPYAFKAPSALKLVTFPGDQYDIYAISVNNQPADQNVLIGVDDLRRTEALKKYITLSKRTYVEEWWKQFGGLRGVSSVTEFTNSMGLKGYKAKYLNSANQTPNEDVFFEVPDPNYVIHLASGPLSPADFAGIIDSVSWGE